jgi:hypothetical protein
MSVNEYDKKTDSLPKAHESRDFRSGRREFVDGALIICLSLLCGHLPNERDREALRWARAFNPYDLYSKCEVEPDLAELRPYYEDLGAEFFPSKIRW